MLELMVFAIFVVVVVIPAIILGIYIFCFLIGLLSAVIEMAFLWLSKWHFCGFRNGIFKKVE